MVRKIHDTLAQAFTGILLHVGAAIETNYQEARDSSGTHGNYR